MPTQEKILTQPRLKDTPVAFGYDAVKSEGRRRPPKTTTSSEDYVLNSAKRKKLTATARDIQRNFATAAWMLRLHLDYISRFCFQCRTGDEKLNVRIEELIAWASRPYNFDVAGRFSREKFVRISEARRTIDGDVWWLKLNSGHVQAIEADRVCAPVGGDIPAGVEKKDFPLGVKVGKNGKLISVCVCRRKHRGNGIKFQRIVPARSLWQFGYIDRFDQVRGITPLAPAINLLQDTYEGIDMAFARAKVAQMFGLVFYRDKVEESEGLAVSKSTESDSEAGETSDPDTESDRYDTDPGRGPFKVDLEPGDRAEMLSANLPEGELLNFLKFTTDIVLKSLDIPYSFYDTAAANYYGKKADLQKYEHSAKAKREDCQQLLNNWTAWRLKNLILDEVLVLPAKMTLADLKWEYVPAGMPWVDKLRDIKADELALKTGLDSEVRIARRGGQDAAEMLRERLDFEVLEAEEREARGLPAKVSADKGPGITDTDKGDDNA